MNQEEEVLQDPRKDEIYYFKTHIISRLTGQLLFNNFDSVEARTPNHHFIDYRRKLNRDAKDSPKMYRRTIEKEEDVEPVIEQITTNGNHIIINLYFFQ